MAKIYVSSTYSDLVEHREAVNRALRQMGQDVVSMETYGAAEERPLDRCLSDVARSDVYVGLFAWRYGFVPPGHDKAITHLEYEHAGKHGRPRLLFLTAEDAPWPPNRMDSDLGPIRKLRAQLRLNHLVGFFRGTDDLAATVSVAVANLLVESGGHEGSGDPDAAADTDFLRRSLGVMTGRLEASIRFYLTVGGAVFGLGLLLLLVGVLTDIAVLSIGGLLILVFAVFPFMTLVSTRRRRDVLSGYADALGSARPTAETVHTVRQFLTQQIAA